MYIFRGGQIVESGIYWEPEKNERVVLKADGFLPGLDNKVYFRLPDSYLLIPVLLLGLMISMIFPYGMGLLLFGVMYAMHYILFSVVAVCEELVCSVLSHLTVAYRPGYSFFSGFKRRSKKSGDRANRDTRGTR